MAEIGATLREARMRARIDVSEIEAQTKIRAKYLRALENEEWDLLPGPTFVKSFLRTYAAALGLDGKALVEEYRLTHHDPSEGDVQPIASTPTRTRARPPTPGPSRGYVTAIGAVCVVIVLALYGLLSGGGGSSTNKHPKSAHSTAPAHTTRSHRIHHLTVSSSSGERLLASVSLQPTAEIYVCLLGAGGRKIIPGVILTPATPRHIYHSKRLELTLGNNAVTLYVNGKATTVAPSSKPIGYSITRSGTRELTASEQPTCT